MNISDVRKKFPQYQDLSDDQLADALHRKFYSDMPAEKFRASIGMSAPEAAPAQRPMSFWDSLKQAAKPEMGIYRGARDVVDAGAQLAVRGANQVGLASDDEVARVDRMNKEAEAQYQQGRSDGKGFDALRLFGNVLTTAPMLGAAPAGAGIAARTGIGALTGAGFGALQPVENTDNFLSEKLGQMKTGAIAGAVAAPLTAALARVVQPKSSPEVQKLLKEGVTPTPGQTLGGWAKPTEEKLTSVPLLGDAIRMGQRRAVAEFDRAAMNRVLAPIGDKLPKGKVGNEAVKHVGDKLDQVYDDVLARVGPVKLDASLSDDMTRILGDLSGTPDQAKQFVTELQREIGKRAKNGVLNGRAFKDIESTLGQRAAAYRQSNIAAEKDLGHAFFEAQKAMREWLQRTAPTGVADDLAKVNEGWAALVRVENAAGMAGARGGIFTPDQLSSGIRRAEKSVRKRGFARGESMMQDLSNAGREVLSQSVPDSGTPGRMLAAALTGGGLGYIHPAALGLAGAAALPYTSLGQKAVAGLLARRPELAKPLAEGVRAVGAPVLTGGLFGLLSQ